MPLTISQTLARDAARLGLALVLDGAAARLEAQLLLCHVLGVTRSYLAAHPDDRLRPELQAAYLELLARRIAGEPLAYILGYREFYGLCFRVGPAVLIPRPETELLVELALSHVPEGKPFSMLELGTGSGAIAVTLAKYRPLATITAVDNSAAALALAQENAKAHGAEKVRLVESDWFSALAGMKFDLIVANPPYIAASDPHLCRGDVRFEPVAALIGGMDGLEAIRAIIAQAPAHLKPGGRLMFEHGYDQAEACRELLRRSGFSEVNSVPDLAGILRVTAGMLPGRGP